MNNNLEQTSAFEHNKVKIVSVSSLGGGLEMYDFVIYIFFAPIIARLFFPPQDPIAAVLATYSVFAVGYLARPLGALIFGHYGDKVSRKNGLVVTLVLMAAATLLIGLLPTYQQIGVWAPVLLVFLRLIQGIAVGGDLPGAITFVAEHADAKKRGRDCAWVYCGVNLGILLASGLGTLLTSALSQESLVAWGWRLAFLFSLVLLVVGGYFRSRMAESPVYQQLQEQKSTAKYPLVEILRGQSLNNVLTGIGIVWLFAVIIAQIFLYMPGYLHKDLHVSLGRALLFNTINLIIFSAFIPVMGAWSDKIGRKKILLTAATLFVFLSYPLYALIDSGSLTAQLPAMFILAVMSAAMVGAAPVTLAELFITRYRYSGIAITYNIGFAIFAGLTPLFATWLIYVTANITALAYNLIGAAIVAFIAILQLKETSRTNFETL